MTIDLAAIPAERLALLDTAMLFKGPHRNGGGGGADCRHCARELLHEVVTGEHADRTPPGCSFVVALLPTLNDGPWRGVAHRTQVMRPYLAKILALDPARDVDRVYALLDHVCRDLLPQALDAVGEGGHAQALRAIAPIKDEASAKAAIALALARDLNPALPRILASDHPDAPDPADLTQALFFALDPFGDARKPEQWEKSVRRVLDLLCAI